MSLYTLIKMWCIAFIALMTCCLAFEQDLTVDVAPGKIEFFYQNVEKPGEVQVEYRVIGGGDLDINFFLHDPNGQVLIAQHRKSATIMKVVIQQPGDMKVSLDNTFSHFANKLVYFKIVSDEDDTTDDNAKWDGAQMEIQALTDMTLDEFKQMLLRMAQNLDRSKNLQTDLKIYEARDRNIAEANFDQVNILSGMQLAVMLIVGLVQVILIRSLFNDTLKASGLMKVKT